MASLPSLPSSSLLRILEPEVMDTEEEARDYDAMDHGSVNEKFCSDLLALGGAIGPRILDVGTGTALIPIELCKREPSVHVVAIDLAEHMIALGKKNVRSAGLHDRIMLDKVDAKKMPYKAESFFTTISNSIVHHIPEPKRVLGEMFRVTAKGGLIFVRDLHRPADDQDVDRLVALYGGEPPADPNQHESFSHQRDLFRASLKAALTVKEVTDLAEQAGMNGASIEMTSDRHWTLVFRKPTS
jgi:ubiquinone/menaquinone biosynthesis C-methylase UbiE